MSLSSVFVRLPSSCCFDLRYGLILDLPSDSDSLTEWLEQPMRTSPFKFRKQTSVFIPLLREVNCRVFLNLALLRVLH